MKRILGNCLLAIAATAIVAIAIQPAWAQPGRGMGRGMGRMRGFSPSMVATLDEVQTDLKLTDEQKSEIETINDDTRSSMREMFESGDRPDMEAFQKLNSEATAKVEKALEPA